MAIALKEIEQFSLFKGIDFQQVPRALASAPVVRAVPGQIILSPETRNRVLYLVMSGTLSVHLETPDSRPIRTVDQGSCVGELSLIEGRSPSAWVKAKTPCTLIALDHDLLWDMVAEDGRISKNLLSIVSQRVIANTELIILGKIRIRELEETAYRDGLTRIYNRRWFDQALVVHMNRFHRDLTPFTLCMADVDRFKDYNDTNGHPAGDNALSAVARTLSVSIRPDDFVARYGGEEFCIILSDTRARDGGHIISRVLDAVRETRITDAGGNALPPVTISIGAAEPRSGDTVDSLIQRADQALYRAKAAGRDCCHTETC